MNASHHPIRNTILFATVALLVACAADPGGHARKAEPPPQADSAHAGRQVEEIVVTAAERSERGRPAPHVIADAVSVAGSAVTMQQELAALPHTSAVLHPGESYPEFDASPIRVTRDTPVSTFSIDVDTAAWANIRRMLESGVLPGPDAVRIEEMINYFDYAWTRPAPGEDFAVHVERARSPFHSGRELMLVGIVAEDPPETRAVARNLVLLVDTSGSMRSPDKLPLLQRSMRLLVPQLGADDRVSIVTYAGNAGVALEPTPGNQHARILRTIDQLGAGGSTHGSAGIEAAYALARESFIEGGANRVILATDGDFNVGLSHPNQLESLISRHRAGGIGLTVLGFGTGNYQDTIAQRLAQKGDGIAAYIDSIGEARKVLVDELDSQLISIARDVKIQIEFNPAQVAEYRLLGYETRGLSREDFDDDSVDAGDVGAGHVVTALYEITRGDSDARSTRPLRYAPTHETHGEPTPSSRRDELAHLRLRWKAVRADADDFDPPSRLLERAIAATDVPPFDRASNDFRFAAAVAGFGEQLRGGRRSGAFDLAEIERVARAARGEDPLGERAEFLSLVRTGAALQGESLPVAVQGELARAQR